jgi:hypothetical protein
LSKQPLVITSRKVQTCTTTINVIQPEEELFMDHNTMFGQDVVESFLYLHSFTKYDDLAIQSKTTTSTGIAMKTTPKRPFTTSPTQYHDYSKVFSETALHQLPMHQPWDHGIELKPGASMCNCSIYVFTPKEAEALKEYITEHL